MTERELGELVAADVERRVRQQEHSLCTILHDRHKHALEIVRAAGVEELVVQPERTRRPLQWWSLDQPLG